MAAWRFCHSADRFCAAIGLRHLYLKDKPAAAAAGVTRTPRAENGERERELGCFRGLCQTDQSAVTTVSGTKELKRRFGSRAPERAALQLEK
jgi:hypothetical protein